MDKSSRLDITLADQQRAWNAWNRDTRERAVDRVAERQAAAVLNWCALLGRNDMHIIDLGCGAGWMSERLLAFGNVTAIDLADEVINRARKRVPQVNFLSGDLFDLQLPVQSFDVVVSLEVLSHVRDQPAFVHRVAQLLKPGGSFMLATQNRFVLERADEIGGPIPGQIRHWVTAKQLRQLLSLEFDISELTSVMPIGHGGILRIVNSSKLNNMLSLFFTAPVLERAKERLLFGHTLLALARKRKTEISN
jgi:2-polyprenyl-3-methyl-5-hydroxy-6-metoxy-1,4-benzoquinol methylase